MKPGFYALTLWAGLTAMPVHAQKWDAHAAAAVLDGEYASMEECEARLTEARALEEGGAPDIDPRLADMFDRAECIRVAGGDPPVYGIRMTWAEFAE